MKTETFNKLQEIHKKHGATEFGRICQDLLALCFLELGCASQNIEVNDVEGVDLVIEDENFGKFAIEVKTTSKNKINFEDKDYQGLKRYKEKQYTPILAVLKLELFSEWIFYDTRNIGRGSTISVNSIYTKDDFKEFSKSLNEKFEKLVCENYYNIFDKGQNYLIQKLKEEKVKFSG